jgi:hypothetical protein
MVLGKEALLQVVCSNDFGKEPLLNEYATFVCSDSILIIFFIKKYCQTSSQYFNNTTEIF